MIRGHTSPAILTAATFDALARATRALNDWQRRRQQLYARRTNWNASAAWRLIETEQLRRRPACERCAQADRAQLLIRYRYMSSYGLEAADMACLETICESCAVWADELERAYNDLL